MWSKIAIRSNEFNFEIRLRNRSSFIIKGQGIKNIPLADYLCRNIDPRSPERKAEDMARLRQQYKQLLEASVQKHQR